MPDHPELDFPTAIEVHSYGALLGRIRDERAAYGLPPRLRSLAERFAVDVLALMFPHFVDGAPGEHDPADDLDDLRRALTAALMPTADSGLADGLFADLDGIREALLLDAGAIYNGDPAAHSVDEVILAYPGFFATAVYRVAHDVHRRGAPLFARLLSEYAHRVTGIDIHAGAAIGPEFAIDHGTGIVIGETAEVGARVKLYQGVTLGATSVSKHRQGTKRHPTVADDVVIYANATILGGDTVIGRGCRVGANVWVTRSIPAYSVVTPTARIDRRPGEGSQGDDDIDFHI
ncbi:MAG: serine O-acetyltransferase EpsC [Solirubrobacteraceae bacterium]